MANWFDIVYEFLRRPDIEDERLEAYADPATGGEPYTIGVGHTGYVDGVKVHLGMRITQQKSAELLRKDIAVADKAVRDLVHVPLTEHQRAALVSFVFNVGVGAFQGSTMRRLLNAGKYVPAAQEFYRWKMANGRILNGLIKRRSLERDMFVTPDET